jgi:hypothetical protein
MKRADRAEATEMVGPQSTRDAGVARSIELLAGPFRASVIRRLP